MQLLAIPDTIFRILRRSVAERDLAGGTDKQISIDDSCLPLRLQEAVRNRTGYFSYSCTTRGASESRNGWTHVLAPSACIPCDFRNASIVKPQGARFFATFESRRPYRLESSGGIGSPQHSGIGCWYRHKVAQRRMHKSP